MEGFSYNGKHSDDFHCYFIPDASDRWFASPDFQIYEADDTGKDGGYFYGTRAKVRTFTLKCYYEEITLARREALRRWLDRSTSGKLVFDRRPFVSYDVRPTKVVPGKRYAIYNSQTGEELYSGTFTVTLSAYQPYGLLNNKEYASFDTDGASECCGILKSTMMPATPTTSSRAFLLYNCGTQPCNTVFRIGGTASTGLTITNNTNGTYCTLTSLPSSGYLEINSELGSVTWVHGTERDLAFSYHTSGYVVLDPYIACEDEVVVSYTASSTSVTRQNAVFDARFVGKYLYLDGAWRKITAVNSSGVATVDSAPTHTGITNAKVVTMNEITITGTSITLTTLEADYFPMIV